MLRWPIMLTSNSRWDYELYLYQLKLTAARLRKGTAQRFRLPNLAGIFLNLSWYDSIQIAGYFKDCKYSLTNQSLVPKNMIIYI